MLRAFGNQHSTCSPHQAESWPASLTRESGRCVFPRASVHPLYILTLYMSLNFAAAVHALRTDLPSTLPDPHMSCLAQELLTMVWLYGKRPCMWPWKAKRMFFGWNADCRMLVKFAVMEMASLELLAKQHHTSFNSFLHGLTDFFQFLDIRYWRPFLRCVQPDLTQPSRPFAAYTWVLLVQASRSNVCLATRPPVSRRIFVYAQVSGICKVAHQNLFAHPTFDWFLMAKLWLAGTLYEPPYRQPRSHAERCAASCFHVRRSWCGWFVDPSAHVCPLCWLKALVIWSGECA